MHHTQTHQLCTVWWLEVIMLHACLIYLMQTGTGCRPEHFLTYFCFCFVYFFFFHCCGGSRNWLICYWASIHHLKATDVPFSIERRMINNDSNLNWKRQCGLQTFFNRGQERQSEKHNELPLLCPSEPGITSPFLLPHCPFNHRSIHSNICPPLSLLLNYTSFLPSLLPLVTLIITCKKIQFPVSYHTALTLMLHGPNSIELTLK